MSIVSILGAANTEKQEQKITVLEKECELGPSPNEPINYHIGVNRRFTRILLYLFSCNGLSLAWASDLLAMFVTKN